MHTISHDNQRSHLRYGAAPARSVWKESAILEEDSIRAQSIRRSRGSESAFTKGQRPCRQVSLKRVRPDIRFNFNKTPLDPRALELVNKTNQFNLNGKRYTEASWRDYLLHPESFLLLASYKDKFGPLGKIAVIAGRQNGTKLSVDAWVMSCRAFSRRIEYACLEELFAIVWYRRNRA